MPKGWVGSGSDNARGRPGLRENIKQGERKNRKATFGVFKPFVETYFHPTQTLKLRGVYVHHDNMRKKRVCEWKILA